MNISNNPKSNHHPDEKDYPNEKIEIETSTGKKLNIQAFLLRVYPTTFNGYDAYMDISKSYPSDIKKIRSSSLGKTWEVVDGPIDAPPIGSFRGDCSNNNPAAWIFGLRLI